MSEIEEQCRTNFFEYKDRNAISNIAVKHNSLAVSNMKGVSLIGSKINIMEILKESFSEEPSIHMEDDMIFVNLI